MRRSSFTEEPNLMALRQAESGTTVADLLRKLIMLRRQLLHR